MTRRREYEAPDMGAFLRRTVRAMTRRASGGDVEALVQLVRTRAELDAQIVEAARGLHDFGYSWGEVAAELGMSRQGAQKRFARAD